jgi:type III restriction enzyme
MNSTANYIKQRLSLRDPLQASLDIVAQLSEVLELNKEVDLKAELAKVKALYPSITSFERDFVSLAFSIATGVGKTRLMGAIVTYLYLEKNIRNFFILAPNLTIYDKLIEDFGNPAYHKYVFNGISEFVHNRPVIITGDNYAQEGRLYAEQEIRINIFNIAKFNSDNRGTKSGGVSLAPRIKRLSEYLGTSYWLYLTSLQDLVILIDEAHRYHADASKNAINELKPILGIELTATPMDEKGNSFKNIVYEYSLAQALSDGKYVKNPAIATRKNFEKGALSDREVEIIKLEDAISIHQDTKNELEIYSKNNDLKLVKPFILVVCRDIAHAKEIHDFIITDAFYDGLYKGKVLQIDSSTRKEEDIEMQFIALESADNEIEIVIHVNMLKEGWDVTNLYTIVPLRAANASVLVEQTIGRGLRLPFDGKRTGVDKIDKLTVVAHENFNDVIKAAQDPNSVLNKMSFIELSKEDLAVKTEVVTSRPVIEAAFVIEQKRIDEIVDVKEKRNSQNMLAAQKAIVSVLPDFGNMPQVRKVEDLKKPEVKEKVMMEVRYKLQQTEGFFYESAVKEAETQYEAMVSYYQDNIIEIPRMDLVQSETRAEFAHFDLDTSDLNYQALNEEILRLGVKDHKVDTINVRTSGAYGNPIKLIISELINYPEIDYDDNATLLYHLATQAYLAVKANVSNEDEVSKVIFQFKSTISDKVYKQMKSHLKIHTIDHKAPKVLQFVRIELWSGITIANTGYRDYQDTINPISMIPKHVFRGFKKACHHEYKFDSKAELDLAFVLEHDETVNKWLRPAPNQFRIYWDNRSKRYEPDFIVETQSTIYMIEVKRSDQVEEESVLAKKVAAELYCKYASDYTAINGGKKWQYMLIPHDEISKTLTLNFLVAKFGE